MQSIISRPLVVIDWNWIRTTKDASLPRSHWYLLPEHVFYEASTASEPRDFARKLHRFLYTNREVVAIGRHPYDVMTREAPGRLASRDDLVYMWMPTDDGSWNDEQWQRLCNAGHAIRKYDWMKSLFDGFREEFFEQLRATAAEKLGATLEHTNDSVLRQFVQLPSAITPLVSHHFEEFNTTEWQVRLEVFPDRHAVGRLCRILLWYYLRRIKVSKKCRLRNDWEDASYAFLASYADQLWTNDKDLNSMVGLLFRDVSVQFPSA